MEGEGGKEEVETEVLFSNYEIFMFLVVLSLMPKLSACTKRVWCSEQHSRRTGQG